MKTVKLNLNSGSVQVPANSMYVFIEDLSDAHAMKLRDLSNFYLEHRKLTPKSLYVDLEYNSALVLLKPNKTVLDVNIYFKDSSCEMHELDNIERFKNNTSQEKKELRLIKTMVERCKEYLYDIILKDLYKNIKKMWVENKDYIINYSLNQNIEFKRSCQITHYNAYNNEKGYLSLKKVKQQIIPTNGNIKLAMNEVVCGLVPEGNRIVVKLYISTHLGIGEVNKASGILGKVLDEHQRVATKYMEVKMEKLKAN